LTQVFDFIGMFLFVYWMIILNASRLGRLSKKALFPTLAVLSAVSLAAVHLMYINHIKFQVIIASAVIVILVTEWLANKKSETPINYKFFGIAMGFMAFAFAASMIDGSRLWCDPTNHWVQGHAIWHVLAAIGLTFAYHHYEQFQFSDRPNIDYDIDEIETQLEV
jgi:hypothetical protein